MSSDRTARRLSRILAVLPYVIGNDGATMADLVERFDYRDEADLVKDLHLVFVTGLPGYGPGDLIDVDMYDDEVFVDAADYFSRPLRLTPSEALGLLAAGMTLLESEQAPEALRSAVDKLVAMIGPDTADAIHLDVPTPPLVQQLRTAIERRLAVEITYVSIASNERTTRIVEGWEVTFDLGNWYLTGYCRRSLDSRTFRIDRIEAATTTEEGYEIPADVAAGRIVYQPTDSDHIVEFTASPRAAWVAEYYPVESEAMGDGSVRIRMSVADPLVAARLLVQLAPELTDVRGERVISEADALRERIRTTYLRTE